MGVRRAVEMVLDAANTQEGPIHTYGPLIHNPQVLQILAEKGVTVLSDVAGPASGSVVIRAHGVPPQVKQSLVDHFHGFKGCQVTVKNTKGLNAAARTHIGRDAAKPCQKSLKPFIGDKTAKIRLPVP